MSGHHDAALAEGSVMMIAATRDDIGLCLLHRAAVSWPGRVLVCRSAAARAKWALEVSVASSGQRQTEA
jgi:hypothetical protein